MILKLKSFVMKACLKANNNELKSQKGSYKKMSAIQDKKLKENKYFFPEVLQIVYGWSEL